MSLQQALAVFTSAVALASCGAEHLRSTAPSAPEADEPQLPACTGDCAPSDGPSSPAQEPQEPPTEPQEPAAQPPQGAPSLLVSTSHVELRSVQSGHPACGGKQVWVSNMDNLVLTNPSTVPAHVTIRLRDAARRFLWSDCALQSERGEIVGVLAPGASWQSLGLTWNSGEDSGLAHSDDTSVEISLEGELHTRVTVHGKSRPPVSCPATLVRWSSGNTASGPCAALAPAMLESLADPGSGRVLADASLSDPGYSGKQGVSCAAVTFTVDPCGVSIPASGGPVYTYPAYSGTEACTQ